MSELSQGGTDEDREQGDMLLEGRDRLAELREGRRDLENGSGQRGMSSGESERLQQETQAAAFDLAHEAMSAEAVKAFVKLKRAEYAAKHAPLVAPTGAGMVVRPPGRACRPERFADLVADSYDSPSAEDSEFASEVSGERSDSGTDAARQFVWLSDSTGEASDAEESTADGMHEQGARTPDVNAWKKTKLKDVHNMLQDLKKADKRNMPDVERTESILEEFTTAVSPIAFDLVAGQIKYALSSDANYVIEGAGEDGKLRSLRSDQVHTSNTKTYKCDCTFARTLLLPCRHSMFYRKTNGNESVLPPVSLLCPRWLRAHPLNDISEGPVYTGEFEYHIIDSAESVAPVVAPMKKDVNYSQAKQLTDELLSLLSNQPTPTFQAAMRWLRGFTKSVYDGELENFAGFVPAAAADLDKVPPSASVAIAAPTQIVVPASEDMDLEEKAPATTVVQSNDDITARKPPNYAFTKPVKNKKMSKKAHSKIARPQRKMGLRNLANLCEGGVPSSTPSASDIDNLLSTNYSYHSVAPALEKYDLLACDVAEDAGLRLLREGEELTLDDLTKRHPADKITYALTILPLRGAEQYVATWKEFGAATHEQLLFLERYVAAKNQLSTVDHTAEWVEDVSWSPADIEAVPLMFWAPLPEKREIIQQQVRDLPLQLSFIGGESIDGHSLLSFRRSQWLSTTAMLVVMKALALKYHDVGVARPSFLEPKAPDRKRVVANAYKAFSPFKGEIIGALNFGSAHWVAFHINVKSRQCWLFDPLQGAKNYVKLKNSLSEVVEPLLPMDTKLMYFKYVSCVQQDSDNCGIWCLVMLELTLAKEKWHKGLYKLVPYLRLRYLNLSLDYINDRRLERN
ncbi:hypothetical protein PR002_g15230 [Phytophthora rubi]|uniref:Ubiquitin-like protease family profile domain-containing protein n=1 Tax=Phytophthora rubi TaxID=129364 RepID=A0A6A3KVS4_9STRA|nr:hypothetical protein PR002_g15230 [Phytophthora rubi]